MPRLKLMYQTQLAYSMKDTLGGPESGDAGGDDTARPLIFVIDDHSFVRSSVRRTLEISGYRVRDFEEGRTAISAFQHETPNLVITDIFMPDADGYEMTSAIKARYPEIPIIAMSGGGPMPLATILKIGEILGAKRSLVKPFSRTELLMAIEDCLKPVER